MNTFRKILQQLLQLHKIDHILVGTKRARVCDISGYSKKREKTFPLQSDKIK